MNTGFWDPDWDTSIGNEIDTEEFLKKYGTYKMRFVFYTKHTFYYASRLENGDMLFCATCCGDESEAFYTNLDPLEEPTLEQVPFFVGWVCAKEWEITDNCCETFPASLYIPTKENNDLLYQAQFLSKM